MNSFFKLAVLTCFLLLFSCASSNFKKNVPFTIHSAKYYSNNNIKETEVYIKYSSKQNIEFDSIYFQKKKAKIVQKSTRGNTYIFAKLKPQSRDLTLNNNPIQELKNTPPTINKFWNQLKNEEAIISYKVNHKRFYHQLVVQLAQSK